MGWKWGAAERVHHARDRRDRRRDHRVHAGDARVDPLLPAPRSARSSTCSCISSSRSRGSRCSPFPLYYQYFPLPAYPYRYAAWFALGWIAAGLLIGLVLLQTRPEALTAGERIYVEDEVSGADVPDMPALAD